jgi:hypothetical protein
MGIISRWSQRFLRPAPRTPIRRRDYRLAVEGLEDRVVPATGLLESANGLVVGSGLGTQPHVQILAPDGSLRASFFAFAAAFSGGVRVATGDVNGDGALDVIAAAAGGAAAHVKVFDGTKLDQVQPNGQLADSAILASFYSFDPGFLGGVSVAAGDFNDDGRDDLVVGAGAGGGSHVKVIDATRLGDVLPSGRIADAALLGNFFAFDPRGASLGVGVAVGDIDGNGRPDIVVGDGPGGAPHVVVVSGDQLTQVQPGGQIAPGALLASFYAFDPGFLGGVSVAAGDFNDDGRDDLVIGAASGADPHVEVVDAARVAQTLPSGAISPDALLASFDAFGSGQGVRVATADIDRDGVSDIIAGTAPGTAPQVRVLRGPSLAELGNFPVFSSGFLGGISVGGRAAAANSLSLLDPAAPVQVDQDSYAIRGTLQRPAGSNTTVLAYRDTNGNGVFDAGQDQLAGSAAVAAGGTSFSVTVSLNQNAANQFFLIAQTGSRTSAPVTAPLITEAPTAPPSSQAADTIATVVLPAINLNLLGLQVQTNQVTVHLAADAGNGKLLGNLLTTASNLIDLQKASDALNQVLGTVVNLLNSSQLGVTLGSGSFDSRPAATTNVLDLAVAPVNLDLLGLQADTSPIHVSITAHSGQGLILGNIVGDLANLFNDLPGQTLNIDTLNQKLGDLLNLVNNALGSIPAATVPTVQPSPGQVLNLTVPALDLNLLGLKLQTAPINVNADAQEGSGNLLGNVLTSLLGTLDATPDKVAQLNNTLNSILARVVGVLNAANLTVPPALVSALPTALQTLLSPALVAPAGSSAPVLDLVIASQDGTSPPVDVNLLGLNITTSDIDAHLSAVTGDGQILGNLLYNLANLANPTGSGGLLSLLDALGAGNLNSTAGSAGGSLSGTSPAPQQLLQIQLDPLNINLLGLQVQSDPITVTLSAQGGDGKLLGNLLGSLSTLINFQGVGGALNNALGTVVNLVNSVDLTLPAGSVGSGSFDTATASDTPVLDAFVAPVRLDLLGLVVTTSPIHLTITAHAGDGLVLGNVVTDLAHLFDNPPPTLTVDDVNARLAQLLDELNAQIPGIAPAPIPPVNLAPGQFLELTVAPINLNLLGLVLKTSPITVNGFDQTGNGQLLGNFLNALLNTIDATPGNLTVLNQNLDALLAKVIGVLNASSLALPQSAITALPTVLQTLLSPVLLAPASGATTPVLNLLIASPDATQPPVRADLLGLVVTTSDIHAQLLAQTGDGQVLGNLLYNVSNLLNPGNTTSLLFLLTELAQV